MRPIVFSFVFSISFLISWGQDFARKSPLSAQFIEKHPLVSPKSLQSSISDTLHIVHYDIHIDTINFVSQSIKAHTGITLVSLVDNLTSIELSLHNLLIDSVVSPLGSLSFTQNNPAVSILPFTTLNSGDTARFTIYYHGNPPEDPSGWGGFTFSGSYAFNMGVGFEVNPHVYGRAWFPCLDVFTDKSYYDFHIKTSGNSKAHCNGALVSVDSLADGSRIYNWHLNHPIPTYLAGLAVGDYTTHYDTSYGIPVEIAAVGNDGPNIITTMAKLDTAVRVFQDFYGPYPWNKIGYSTVPFNAGAMEHATNIHIGRLFMDGSLDFETLWAHELSHMWWGDMVTCSSQEDMWLNEGFASYNENLFTEAAYGKTAYKNIVRKNHRAVVQFCHVKDGSYLPLNAVPFQYTYSTTVYDKGSDIAHTLKAYLGDSLYKVGCKHYMNTLAYGNASSADFRDKLTEATGVDMTEFFDGWVFSPGFPHFSLDSFNVTPIPFNSWKVDIYTSQKGLGNSHIYKMPVKISFYNGANVSEVHSFLIDSLTNHFSVEVQIPPSMLALDRDEEMSDAILDYEQKIKTSGTIAFPETNCSLILDQVPADSVLVRVEHHFMAPDTLDLPQGITKISDYHYWSINGSWNASFVAKAKFSYDGSPSTTVGYQDNTFITGSENYLRLLYRPDRGSNWQLVNDFTLNKGNSASDKKGNMQVDTLRKGEYCFGWSETALSVKPGPVAKPSLGIYPNPSVNELKLDFTKIDHRKNWTISVIDTQGRVIQQQIIYPHQTFIKLDISQLKPGSYLVSANELGGETKLSERFVKE
jgi:aminopeptidase N